MDAYRKEIISTLGFFVLYLLAAHTAPWALLLGTDNSVRILGFPLHYFAAVFLGWLGVLAVSIWWNRYADALEDEIAATTTPDAAPVNVQPEGRHTHVNEGNHP